MKGEIMNWWKSVIGNLTLIVMAMPVVGLAQDFSYRGSVFGGAGYGNFLDDEGSIGTGPTYRSGAEWRVLPRLALRGEFIGMHHSRNDYFRVRGNAEHVLGKVAFYFSRSKVQPYITAGLGLQHVAYSYSWPAAPQLGVHRVAKTDLAAAFGLGMKLFVSRHWSLDPEFTAITGRGAYTMANYISMKAAYHW
jgi:opacity protein-like surface antigen